MMFRSIQRVASLTTAPGSKALCVRCIVHASQRGGEPMQTTWGDLDLLHPLKNDPESIVFVPKNMWTKPPAADAAPLTLPFAVERTEVGNALPVYTDYKGGGTKVQTMIRRIRGDVHALKGEMEKGKLLHILVRIIA